MGVGTISFDTYKPGINTQISQSANRKGFSKSNLIRWKKGVPEKLGGWGRISDTKIVGMARGLHAWADLAGVTYLIAGTDQRVALVDGGTIYDITPLRLTRNPAVDFSTVIATPNVTIKDVAHGANVGDWIDLQTQVAVGGLILYGYYQIATVVDADSYTITASKNATATVNHGGAVGSFHTNNTLATVDVTLAAHGLVATNLFVVEIPLTVGGITLSGTYSVTSVTNANVFVITHSVVATSSSTASQNSGNARILYLLPTGLSSAVYSLGYGVGDFGSGDYGTGSGVGALNPLREWFFDTWGAYAIMNYTLGPFYVWIPPVGTNPRATIIATAPQINTASFVATPQQIVVAIGCETGGVFDPNLVRWCAVADYTTWTATATNQAGSFRIPTGSRIVGGLQAPNQALIWTDLDLWSMRYIQPPYVFGFTKISGNCGLIAARAAWTAGTETYWMSSGGFFKIGSGGVEDVPCAVWDVIFKNLNLTQAEKIFAAGNADFNEITWYWASASGTGEVDSYAKLSLNQRDADGNQLWDYGSLARTAWEDRSVFGKPVGADLNGYLQQHETSNNADGAAMTGSFVETGYEDMEEGQDCIFMDRVWVDFISDVGSVLSIAFKSLMSPRSTTKNYGPYSISDSTKYVNPRVRGRLVAFHIGSDSLNSFWRLGKLRFRAAPDGRE